MVAAGCRPPHGFTGTLMGAAPEGPMSSRKRSRVSDTDDLVHLYLHEAGQYELLDKQTEADLAQRIEAGSNAREQLHSSTGLTPAHARSLARTAREDHQA